MTYEAFLPHSVSSRRKFRFILEATAFPRIFCTIRNKKHVFSHPFLHNSNLLVRDKSALALLYEYVEQKLDDRCALRKIIINQAQALSTEISSNPLV